MSGHQRCTQLNSISVGKEITGIPSRPTGILQHLEVFTYYLKLKEKGHFFIYIKSNPLTRRLEVTRAETGNYWFFCWPYVLYFMYFMYFMYFVFVCFVLYRPVSLK